MQAGVYDRTEFQTGQLTLPQSRPPVGVGPSSALPSVGRRSPCARAVHLPAHRARGVWDLSDGRPHGAVGEPIAPRNEDVSDEAGSRAGRGSHGLVGPQSATRYLGFASWCS